MEKQGRYSTFGSIEDQYMPGSNGRILKNLPGINSQREIEQVETESLFHVTEKLLKEVDKDTAFTAKKIIKE